MDTLTITTRWLALLLVLGYGAPLLANQDVTRNILKAFEHIQVLQGKFVQQKKLSGFTNPLVSTGTFLSVRNHGLIWRTQTPVPSTLVMTPGKITQKTQGREQTFQASGTGYDGLGILLPALLDGDLPLLESYFFLRAKQQATGWELSLIPRDKKLAAVIAQVVILGQDNQLDNITTTGPNGDVTRIEFTSLTLSQKAPDAATLAAFN